MPHIDYRDESGKQLRVIGRWGDGPEPPHPDAAVPPINIEPGQCRDLDVAIQWDGDDFWHALDNRAVFQKYRVREYAMRGVVRGTASLQGTLNREWHFELIPAPLGGKPTFRFVEKTAEPIREPDPSSTQQPQAVSPETANVLREADRAAIRMLEIEQAQEQMHEFLRRPMFASSQNIILLRGLYEQGAAFRDSLTSGASPIVAEEAWKTADNWATQVRRLLNDMPPHTKLPKISFPPHASRTAVNEIASYMNDTLVRLADYIIKALYL